jgi:hypothetical protein
MNYFDWFKIGSSYVVGTLAFAACLYFAWTGPSNVLQVLLCLAGGALGWIIGILVSPLDAGEKKQFSDFAKALVALISGYLVGKVDSLLQFASAAANEELLVRVLLFATCFLLTAQFTFVGRRYLRGSEAEQQRKRERAIAELQEALAKLVALN